MNRFMRLVVLFDLPVKTKKQRHDATAFRNFLLKDGYHMLQIFGLCAGLQRCGRRTETPRPSAGSSARQRCHPVPCHHRKAVCLHRDSAGAADRGRRPLCRPAADNSIIFSQYEKALQPCTEALFLTVYYTIPRTVRELQPTTEAPAGTSNYTHTKNRQGTTTQFTAEDVMARLYHTKNRQGTTTSLDCNHVYKELYHTKNCQGTTTFWCSIVSRAKL